MNDNTVIPFLCCSLTARPGVRPVCRIKCGTATPMRTATCVPTNPTPRCSWCCRRTESEFPFIVLSPTDFLSLFVAHATKKTESRPLSYSLLWRLLRYKIPFHGKMVVQTSHRSKGEKPRYIGDEMNTEIVEDPRHCNDVLLELFSFVYHSRDALKCLFY